jgi:hypothetical protein
VSEAKSKIWEEMYGELETSELKKTANQKLNKFVLNLKSWFWNEEV